MSALAKSRPRPTDRRASGVIRVLGARTHNLQDVSLDIPRDRLVVFTGVSGSGKSSLAYDTIYAEGQRRYLESVSTYSRSFIEQIERPDVDRIEGLPPTVSVSQQVGSVRPRSTLATTTEIYDFLRLIFARAGIAHSPATGARVERQTPEQVVDAVLRFGERAKLMVLAPIVRGRKGAHVAVFEKIAKEGFVRARADGVIVDTAEPPKLAKTKPHSIEAVVDRLIVKEGVRARLRESVELALKLGEGLCIISRAEGDEWQDRRFSEKFVCPDTGESFDPLEPRSFSFNSPYGACQECDGLGLIAGEELGGLNGDDSLAATNGSASRCPTCQGERLNAFSRLVTLDGVRLPELVAMPVSDTLAWTSQLVERIQAEDPNLDLTVEGRLASAKALPEVVNRLRYLNRVGLGYLTLDRRTNTLSGGEYQRARLSGCLGAGLIGVGYVLDEPTIGLHPRDIGRLIDTLRDLRDAGNSVLVVEHDLSVIGAADVVIDLGPGAGAEGGRVVAMGSPDEISSNPDSPTGPYLVGGGRKSSEFGSIKVREQSRRADAPRSPRAVDPDTPRLRLANVARHNLKGIDVAIPLGRFVAVTGVSGSGKSTLVMDVLVPTVRKVLAGRGRRSEVGDEGNDASLNTSDCRVFCPESLQRLVPIDQSPLGRTSRSTPATYSGVWDEIRKVFATTKEARVRGFKASRFSYTSVDGRCPECKGLGTQKIEMKFLPDVFVTCSACDGRRFNRQTLSITFRGKSVADVLRMRIDEAAAFFASAPKVRERLETLANVGLGYVELGQSALTLSGGESQRVRLATELSVPGKLGTSKTLYVLDEPTTGLHPRDIERLIDLLQRLTDDGHTVLVIEHEPMLIAQADWVIDLGPEGGKAGGQIVAACPPVELSKNESSHTGHAIAAYLPK